MSQECLVPLMYQHVTCNRTYRSFGSEIEKWFSSDSQWSNINNVEWGIFSSKCYQKKVFFLDKCYQKKISPEAGHQKNFFPSEEQ